DGFHHSMKALDRKMHPIRKKLYAFGTELNGEIEQAKSHIEETRSLTKQRIQLYRQSNIRHRRLLPPPSFRRDTEFPTLQWWPTVSMNNNHHPEGTRCGVNRRRDSGSRGCCGSWRCPRWSWPQQAARRPRRLPPAATSPPPSSSSSTSPTASAEWTAPASSVRSTSSSCRGSSRATAS